MGTEIVAKDLFHSYGIVILNQESRECLILEINEETHGGPTSTQIKKLKEFCRSLGKINAVTIAGSYSQCTPTLIKNFLTRQRIDPLEFIEVQSGGVLWNITFDADTRMLNAVDQDKKLLFAGQPFPDYDPFPAEMQGLTFAQRLIEKLAPFTDADTGLLCQEAIEALCRRMSLRRSYEMDFPGGLAPFLLSRMVDARAQKAGFDDSTEYFDSDQKNFTDVDPESPELLLRSLSTPGASIKERFRRAGRDLDAVRITPEAVVDMLADYPEVVLDIIGDLSKTSSKEKPAPEAVRLSL